MRRTLELLFSPRTPASQTALSEAIRESGRVGKGALASREAGPQVVVSENGVEYWLAPNGIWYECEDRPWEELLEPAREGGFADVYRHLREQVHFWGKRGAPPSPPPPESPAFAAARDRARALYRADTARRD